MRFDSRLVAYVSDSKGVFGAEQTLLNDAFGPITVGDINGDGRPDIINGIQILLANGTLADVLLFGGFLVWAVLSFTAARRRDRAAGITYPSGPTSRTAITVAVGLVAWALFAFALHRPLIGVAPFG